jgi:hypothetical protein
MRIDPRTIPAAMRIDPRTIPAAMRIDPRTIPAPSWIIDLTRARDASTPSPLRHTSAYQRSRLG